MRKWLIIAVLASSSAQAQMPGKRGVASFPATGMEVTASAGSPIFQRENVWQVEGLKLLADVPAADLKAGERLTYWVRTKRKIVGCPVGNTAPMRCLVDRMPAQKLFTEQADALGIDKAPLATPVAYETGVYVDTPGDKGTFRQQLSFLGVSGSTLRLSYREFSNDMARPAFTDEVTFTLSGKFPETVAYKDVVIDVLGISNAGMRYVVKSTSLTYIEPPGAPIR